MQVAVEGIVETLRSVPPPRFQPGHVCQVLQGLTMKPLIRHMDLRDDDPVAREIKLARAHAYGALLAEIDGDDSPHAKLLRKEYATVVELGDELPQQATLLEGSPGSWSGGRVATGGPAFLAWALPGVEAVPWP